MAVDVVSRAPRTGRAAIDGVPYDVVSEFNKSSAESGFTQFKDFVGSSYGAYKFSSLFNTVFKEAAEIADLAGSPATAGAIRGPGGVFGKIAGAFIMPYWAFMTIKLKDSIQVLSDKGASGSHLDQFLKDSLEWTNAGCHTLLHFIPGVSELRSVATVADLGSDVIDVKMQANKWSLADEMQGKEAELSPEIRNDIVQQKKHVLISMIKAIVSVVAGIFAVLALIIGAVIPAIVATTVGCVAIGFTFFKQFYGDNLERKVSIDRFVAPIVPPQSALAAIASA